MNKPHILLAQTLWRAHLKPGDIAYDMTCGNGHDTLFLTELGATVYGFDIQEKAIESTRVRAPKAHLFHCSHENVPQLPTPRLIVYNLGYLPGGDKSIVTTVETTLKSLDNALLLLADDGALSITCYPGHAEGQREEAAIMEWAKKLPKKTHHQWLDRARAPSLLWIVR